MKRIRRMFIFLLLISIFSLLSIPLYSFSEEMQFDQELVDAGKQKAQKMGYNPLCIYLDKNGSMFTKGKIAIRNNRATLVDGDMVINVGEYDATVWGTILKKGEYGVIKNGKLGKAKDIIIPKK